MKLPEGIRDENAPNLVMHRARLSAAAGDPLAGAKALRGQSKKEQFRAETRRLQGRKAKAK